MQICFAGGGVVVSTPGQTDEHKTTSTACQTETFSPSKSALLTTLQKEDLNKEVHEICE